LDFTRHAKNPGEGAIHRIPLAESPPHPKPSLRHGFDLSPQAGRGEPDSRTDSTQTHRALVFLFRRVAFTEAAAFAAAASFVRAAFAGRRSDQQVGIDSPKAPSPRRAAPFPGFGCASTNTGGARVVLGMQHPPTTFCQSGATPKKSAHACLFCFHSMVNAFQIGHGIWLQSVIACPWGAFRSWTVFGK
jgi:hypothetical protein